MIKVRHKCKISGGKIIPSDPNRFKQELSQYEGKEASITIEKWTKKRTDAQNRALHLYFTLLAESLNLAGYDMRKVIRPDVEISWSPISVKEYLWRPIQKEILGKKSTTQLTTEEIDKIYDQINRIIGERTGVYVNFPNIEDLFLEEDAAENFGVIKQK